MSPNVTIRRDDGEHLTLSGAEVMRAYWEYIRVRLERATRKR